MDVRAVISMPRLSFTYSNFDLFNALYPLGIPIYKRHGGTWDHGLTALIEQCLEAKYILTLDYDSRFHRGHVEELYRLMEAHPEADAIAPVQIRRGETTPLFTIKDPNGGNKTLIEIDAKSELLQVHTAHFGLTMLRTSAIKDLSKPWFWTTPDRYGGWEVDKGAVQCDIYFWRKWEEHLKTVFVAHKVKIGHGFESVLCADENLNGIVIPLEEYERRCHS